MKAKDALKFMMNLFCAITTFETLFISVLALFSSGVFEFTVGDLYKIPLVALLGVIPMPIMIYKESASKTEVILRKTLHFASTAALVLGALAFLRWLDAANAAIIIIFFLAVYAAATAIEISTAKKLAERLNERIAAFHDAENATHSDEP